MTRERTHAWPADTRPEKAWRPADYPPLATESSGSDRESGAASQEASSGMTPECDELIVRLRDRVVAQEGELLDLLDEFQHMGNGLATPQRSSETPVSNGRHPREEQRPSQRDLGAQDQRNAPVRLLPETGAATSASTAPDVAQAPLTPPVEEAAGDALFRQAVQEDSNREMDWLWLAAQVAPVVQRRYALERALRINPQSAAGRRGLLQLSRRPDEPLDLT